DISPDGHQLIVTDRTAAKIYVFGRCDASGDPGADCDGNSVRDLCDIALGNAPDCNFNGVPDGCDLDSGFSDDCNQDGVPDECPFCPQVELVFLMDTSTSMNDEGAALCNSVDAVIAYLGAAGIDDLLATKLGIWDTPGGQYSCLESSVPVEFGTEVPGSPPPGNEFLGDCPGGNQVGQEDWGRAISVVAGVKPWLAGTLRLIVPLSDEGPWCGDPITVEDQDSIDHAITIALANGVIVSPVTGTGSSSGVIALAQQIADATGGIQFTSTQPADDIAEAIRNLVLDACFAASDCNGNGVLDSCDIDNNTSDDDNGNGIPDECECPADFDGDGQVGITDFLALLAAWGPNPGHVADLDGDGQVGITDFLALLAAWGPCL
ncbi:MAG: dockerin type I domain-containing protein, partial [Planctomycetota bacterium]